MTSNEEGIDITGHEEFMSGIESGLKAVGIDVSGYEMDHIAYRCDDLEEYEYMKMKFSKYGELVAENIISDRPISIFELYGPIISGTYRIPAIELVSPRQGKKFINGYEHAEFVIPDNLREFRSRFGHLEFEERYEKAGNEELVLGLRNGLSVKFHNKPILEVVQTEDNAGKK